MTMAKRPLLSAEQRAVLYRLLGKVAQHTSDGPSRAYASGVYDVLNWLGGEDPTPMLEDVTR